MLITLVKRVAEESVLPDESRLRIQLDGLSPFHRLTAGRNHWSASGVYPANLCPLSGWVAFAVFRENFAEAIGESVRIRRIINQPHLEQIDLALKAS